MSTRLVSTMKESVNGRLRKNKEGVWGVPPSEEADVKKFSSLQEIPSLLCYCMGAPSKSCSEEMDHLLPNSVILHPWATPSLQGESVATAWLGTFQKLPEFC